ncbi:auxin-responsive protein IAA18-like [Silene latifolia]|uniref:auxin-responsive protein IAA18-like n=1 Tax=Silene latifolia TaxID=37657 RepID=UPI003D76D15C
MGEISPKLLDLMMNKRENECFYDHNPSSCDEKKLELKLGLPCEEDWQNKQVRERKKQDSLLSLNYLNNNGGGGVRVQSQSTISQKRAAPTPVVGWPPIRSFRKNLASSSSGKSSAEPQTVIPTKPANEKRPAAENSNKGLFVKINMDGVPIGRKVDLNAYNCYDSLSSAIDTLFRGLLTALQVSSSAGGMENKQNNEQKPITGLLDGTGEYTLVYEDNEGDRMLVGDVPWQMFVSTVKRLRVLKTSDLPTLRRVGKKDKLMVENGSK